MIYPLDNVIHPFYNWALTFWLGGPGSRQFSGHGDGMLDVGGGMLQCRFITSFNPSLPVWKREVVFLGECAKGMALSNVSSLKGVPLTNLFKKKR